jgi:predicted molibdopterin-dependent oxidoreductase YjgC
VPHPEGVRPVWWALSEVLTGVGGEAGFGTPEDVFAAVCAEVPFYGATAYEEIGGQGLRWQERDPGASWKPGDGGGGGIAGDADSPIARSGSEEAAAAAYASPSTPPPPTADGQDGLVLGTYRDLWATDVTKRNPALRFLMPKQKLEVAAKDAEELELANGDEVTVSVNGSSVEARVAVRERMRPGAAFLIEGTDEANANVLTNGTPQRIQVVKR